NLNGKVFAHAQASMYTATGSFGVLLNEGVLELEARAWLGGGRCDGITKIVTTSKMTVGEWAFLTVAVDDAAQTIKLYKNGELVGTGKLDKTGSNDVAHGIGLLADECVFVVGSANLSCDIDEIQIWNKTQTENEIKASIIGKYLPGSIPSGLLAYYKFDDTTGNVIQNLGAGSACEASVMKGTIAYDPAIYADRYTCSPFQAQYVEGHAFISYPLTYNGTANNGTFYITDNAGTKIESGANLVQYSVLKVVATPAAGYYVKAIKVNDKAIEGTEFILAEASTVTVEFSNTTTATYTAVEGGKVELFINDATTATPFGTEFTLGSKATLKVTASEGHSFASLKVNGEVKTLTAENTYVITNVTGPLVVEAAFTAKTFTVSYVQPANGGITVFNGATNVTSGSLVDYGTTLTVTLTPSSSATLKTFTMNEVDKMAELVNGKTFSVVVKGAITFAATFEVPTYVITYNATPANGKVEVFTGVDPNFTLIATGTSVANNTELTVIMTPNSGCTFKSIKANNALVDVNELDVDATSGIATYWAFVTGGDLTLEAEFTNTSGINGQNINSLHIYYDEIAQSLIVSENISSAVIYGLTGNEVQSATDIDKIDVSALSAGCYLVKVATISGSKVMKFIKR
ncbi:MAG: LamG-like jellyroll fold domain-containing protein, partial [Bacteroides sp.]